MKNTRTHIIIITALTALGVLAPARLFAQQFPMPTTAAEVPGPAAGNTMTKEYVQMVGRMAYLALTQHSCHWGQ